MIPYRFHPKARQEYLAFIRYLKKEAQPATARRFKLIFDNAMDLVCEHPQGSRIIAGKIIHRKALRVFPISIIYRVDQGRVIVLAVAHQRKKPDYWKEDRLI